MSNAMSQPKTALRLARCRRDDPGHAYGLRAGDILIALDAKPLCGSVAEAARHVAQAGRPVVLTFLRAEVQFNILSTLLDLGTWEQVEKPEVKPQPVPAPDLLRNWEIIARPDGTHDLYPLAPSLIALVLPGFWLAQNRLWTWLATLGAALAFAVPLGEIALGLIWVLAGVYFRVMGPQLLRADRALLGYHRRGVLAAASETEACAIWLSINPNCRFRFSPALGQGRAAEA
jgi:hypothetical protein